MYSRSYLLITVSVQIHFRNVSLCTISAGSAGKSLNCD